MIDTHTPAQKRVLKRKDEKVLKEIDELFGNPKTKHYVATTIAEQRIYDNALKQMSYLPPQEIVSSLDCQLKMLELPIGI